ncbi:MAG: S49 family peptidase, partial [Pseudomonadota bacterium]
VNDLLDKVGVAVEEIKSAPLKSEPSPFHAASDEAKAMIRSMVSDSYNWFVDLVAEGRGLSRVETLKLADGSIFTGRQAADNGLVDIIGGQTEIRAFLTDKGIGESLRIVDWEPRRTASNLFFADALIRLLTAGEGGSILYADQLRQLAERKLFLDGLVSVWQFGPAEQ